MLKLAILYGSDFGESVIKTLVRRGFKDSIVYTNRMEFSEEFMDDVELEVPKADFTVAIDVHPDILLELPSALRGCKALIVPIEKPISKGLVNQLIDLCKDANLEVSIPKPFCSLTPQGNYVRAFVETFGVGRPIFKIKKLKVGDRVVIRNVDVVRENPCGLAKFVAEKLRGFTFKCIEELWMYLSKLHHSYPCTASMQIDTDYGDTLLHVSGFILRDAIDEALNL
ncbi:DUF166 domain-containing protein [Archaeoglobus sp.]